MDAGAVPLAGAERREERDRLPAPPSERVERFGRVVPEVLALLGPAIRVRAGEARLVHRDHHPQAIEERLLVVAQVAQDLRRRPVGDRKSTRLNSSHSQISYAVFCLEKNIRTDRRPYSGTASPFSHRSTPPTPA